jgi:hypothetical protein
MRAEGGRRRAALRLRSIGGMSGCSRRAPARERRVGWWRSTAGRGIVGGRPKGQELRRRACHFVRQVKITEARLRIRGISQRRSGCRSRICWRRG